MESAYLKPSGKRFTPEQIRAERMKSIGWRAKVLMKAGWYSRDDVLAMRQAITDGESMTTIERMLAWAIDDALAMGLVVMIGRSEQQPGVNKCLTSK